MGSLIFKVLKEKSSIRSNERQSQKQKIEELKKESIYAYRLRQEFTEQLDKYFDDDDVQHVHIVVPAKHVSIFLKVIFREEFAEYKISQVSDREFEISRKEIYL